MKDRLNIGIVGGSISGLASAGALLQDGHEVHVFERSPDTLVDRGAGIMVDPSIKALFPNLPGLAVSKRIGFDRTGRMCWEREIRKWGTRWSSVYAVLHAQVPDDAIRRGEHVCECGTDGEHAWLATEDGTRRNFDLVIGADGIGSVVRKAIDPSFEAEYLGYVALRGILPFEQCPPAADSIVKMLQNGAVLNFFLEGSHIVAYDICPSNEGDPAGFNWMWYRNLPQEQLADVLKTRHGRDQKWSVAPGAMTDHALQLFRGDASRAMDPVIADVLMKTNSCSLQAIHAGTAKSAHAGRLVLLGDAFRIGIPHIGAGTSFAITDARSLASAISRKERPTSLEECLAGWAEDRRVATEDSLDFARELGQGIQFDPQEWTSWNSAEFDAWWNALLAGRKLYFECPPTD